LTPSNSRAGSYILLVASIVCSPLPASSQLYSGTGGIHEVFVGAETEAYLRYMDLIDTTSSASWQIRPLSPSQLRALGSAAQAGPWAAQLRSFDAPRDIEAGLLSPGIALRYNSQFPYGSNDGAIWAGRGATTSAQVGAFAVAGPFSITLLPVVFRAENAAFPVAFSPAPCGCADPIYGGIVDRPQRFGADPYQRFDPGQSTIRGDLFGLAGGVTTANESWGPMVEYPFILGDNAPGFLHAFAGTSHPLPIFIGRAQARVIYGRLEQSEFSPVTGSKFYTSNAETGRVRFASGLILTFQPRGFDGLEIGGARFIHSIYPRSGLPESYLKKPLQAFLKVNLPGIDQRIAGTDNQLASAFARWAFRESGLEVYGEYGREDNAYDLRDLTQEPDHSRAYSLGLAKVVANQPQAGITVLRAEIMNFQLPPLATTRRGEGSIYYHSPTRQGHTNRGQLLGADIGVGAAAAATVRLDRYSTGGRWAVFLRRNLRGEGSDPNLAQPQIPQQSDVLDAVGFERMKFTRRLDITSSLTLMRDFSRDFGNSRFNANAAVAITLPQNR